MRRNRPLEYGGFYLSKNQGRYTLRRTSGVFPHMLLSYNGLPFPTRGLRCRIRDFTLIEPKQDPRSPAIHLTRCFHSSQP